jgi:hypothetical protein
LRNEIIHYSPDMTAGNKWPIRTKEAFFKSNPKMALPQIEWVG